MRRARFGEVLKALGPRGGADVRPLDPGKVAARQDHLDAQRRLAEGGKNKGEQRGFGLTASPAVRENVDSRPPPVLDPEGTCAYCRARVDDMSGDAVATTIDGEPRVWCNEVCLAAWTDQT